MASATIDLGLNAAPFEQGLAQAERSAGTFTSRIQSIFRRGPHTRASRALGGFLGDLAAGDLPLALQGISHRLGGIGLAAGVGIGAAVIVFQKFRGEIKEAEKASKALGIELAKPLSLQAGLGAEGLTSQIDLITKATDELLAKRDTIGSRLSEALKKSSITYRDLIPDTGDPNAKPGDNFPQKSDLIENRIAAAQRREAALSAARADAELKVVDIRRIGLEDSAREGALQEVSLKAEERRSKLFLERGLTKPGRSALDLLKSSIALRQDERLSRDEAAKKFDLKKQEEEVENRILNLHASSLTKEQQSSAALRERINLLKQRAAETGNVEEKTNIGTQIHKLENEQLALNYNESKKSWSQRASEMMAQRDYQNFVDRQTPSNPNAYLSSPDASNRRDILGNRVDEAGNFMGPGGGPDKQGVGLLGTPGVLDRIEKNTANLGANK